MERLGVQMVWEGRCKLKYRDTGYGYDSYDSRGRRLSLDIDVSPTLARVLDGEARKGRYLFLQRRHLIGVVDGVPHHVVWPNPGWGRRARCQEIALIIQD